MTTQKTLFTQVKPFYQNLVSALEKAQSSISMMYYAFDHGKWAHKISKVLTEKAQSGVCVRLIVDQFGQLLDDHRHAIKNRILMRELMEAGVQVVVFNPKGNRLSKLNRLHCKISAIDHNAVFLGGSNIGDHYTGWDDTNLLLSGPIGDRFHQITNYVGQFSDDHKCFPKPDINLTNLIAGDAQILLTVPKHRCDIRRALLKLIFDAEKSIYIRTWYFLPDSEILNALRSRAEEGVDVNILLSHRTRVRPIDFANIIHCHKIARSGGRVIRYTKKFMHAKVAWNDQDEVILGSANLESNALHNSFECCISLNDHNLASNLRKAFEADSIFGFIQTPDFFWGRSLQKKVLSRA
jgi:cardiolipin synthase